ncbi:hypothetical protein O7606_23555 [Micromonospora sp. WMMD882]|uniref:hypothetical protein n=1 Tax=Micromonospora sp. WMMD882 TaxID=3015151 RepID=UPI00248C9E81|nr:hypothetical protein [Micromonospora sp. WMMD882]WBB79125.1 hypothetical protein O7606_23555 [Micromonospora sp. WMMD882]
MAYTAYVFEYVYSGNSFSVYLHGFPRDTAVAYSVRPVRVVGGGAPIGARLTVGPVYPHVDGTLARVADVEGIWHDHIGSPPWSFIMLDAIEEAIS